MTDNRTDIAAALHYQMLLQLFMYSVGVMLLTPEERNPSIFDQRLAWDEYCRRHELRGTLQRRLRMSKKSFDKLLEMVEKDLHVNFSQADKRGGPILPALCLFCTLRWLSGGSYLDITDVVGISKSSFYRVIWKTITAICKCSELALNFPKTVEQVKEAAAGFASISTEQAIINCCGACDGYLLRIKVPNRSEVKNVRSFFSGHYQCYGVNIQAVADHNSRFIFFAFAAPGVTGDRDAMKQCSLHDLVEGLPRGYCVIGDAAYAPTEHMVPVYQGLDKTNKKYDNFNFYASQLRIRVEMAFGMMQAKWGILQRPLCVSVKNMLWLVQAIARLHNYCINERLLSKEGDLNRRDPTAGTSTGYVPTVPHNRDGDPVRLDGAFEGSVDGQSFLREWMADRVERKQLSRPGKDRSSIKRRRVGDEEPTGDEVTVP